MYKILAADDEAKIREAIYDYLTAKGFDVTLASNGEKAVCAAEKENFDLIILDVMMPVKDGLQACREIRGFSKTPILFLSALGEESDFLKGYKSGGDDYIVKPFPLSVLQEKCNAMIRRFNGVGENNQLTLSGITVDFNCVKVFSNGVQTDISGKDFKLLSYLMQNKGTVISREKILDYLWGYDFDGDLRVVDTHIKRIRRSLGENAGCIKTVFNSGYCFEEV